MGSEQLVPRSSNIDPFKQFAYVDHSARRARELMWCRGVQARTSVPL